MVWALGVLVGLAPGPARGADLVLIDARCVDPVARTIERRSVWIRDGVVAALGAPDGADLPGESRGSVRWNLEGGYLLPGLHDVWVHGGTQRSPGHRDRVGALGTAQLALAAGVVGFLDVHLDSEMIGLRGAWSGNDPRAARPRVGGPLITVEGGTASDFPGARLVDGPQAVRALVDSLAALDPSRRPDALGFVFDAARGQPRLTDQTLPAGLRAARAQGLPAAVQVGSWRDAYEALGLGADWLVQLPFGVMPEAVRERVSEREVLWTPTVTLGLDFARLLGDPELRSDPLLARILPELLLEDYAQVRVPQSRFAEMAERRDTAFSNLEILVASGVRLRLGSAAGALGTAFGWSLLREVEWVAEALGDPWLALASALPADHPGVAVGAEGDFVVLPRSPVDDPTALRSLEAVVLAGSRVDPAAVAASVTRTVEEDIPPDPLPFGGRVPLVVLVIAAFTVLLVIRRWVKRAAARARET